MYCFGIKSKKIAKRWGLRLQTLFKLND